NVVLLIRPVVRQQRHHLFSKNILRTVSIETFGAIIPREDSAVQRFADDGILSRFNDGRQLLGPALEPATLRNVPCNVRRADDSPLSIAYRGNRQGYIYLFAALGAPDRLEV